MRAGQRRRNSATRAGGVQSHGAWRTPLILKPSTKAIFRRMIIGRKRLPSIEEHERTWGFVDLVTTRPEEIEDELDPVTYETKTRGPDGSRRSARPVRACTRWWTTTATPTSCMRSSSPKSPGAELNINPQASLIATVRNPEAPAPPQAGMPPSRHPDYPNALREKFAGRRFTNLDPPDFLDHPGTELILIGASPDVTRELGLSLHPRRETERSADIFTLLGMERDLHPLEPLLTGEWR
jgi:hypothetical protein